MTVQDIPFENLLNKRVWNIKKTQKGTIIKLNYAPMDDRDPSFDIIWDDDFIIDTGCFINGCKLELCDLEAPNSARALAPWTSEQVNSLNRYQYEGHGHSYECPNCHGKSRLLIATEEGWRCHWCPYTQNWAHPYTADGRWMEYCKRISAWTDGRVQFGTMPEILPTPYESGCDAP